jgi:hypothetical protein
MSNALLHEVRAVLVLIRGSTARTLTDLRLLSERFGHADDAVCPGGVDVDRSGGGGADGGGMVGGGDGGTGDDDGEVNY